MYRVTDYSILQKDHSHEYRSVSLSVNLSVSQNTVKTLLYLYRVTTYAQQTTVTRVVRRSGPNRQERPAVADKPARRLRNVCTVYVRAVGL